MSRATVLLVLAALSYGGRKAYASEPCNITDDETATCVGEQFKFPLNLPENITQLYIHSTQVKTISKDNFAQYNELEVIDLSNCDITDINPDTFTALPNLNELNLAANKELSGEKTFISSQSLTKLNLSETGIKTIRENFLEDLPNLEELDLSYASLTETEISALLKLSNLSTLIISDDYIDQLNNVCGETNLRTIIYKTGDDNETQDCPDLKEKDTTTVQQDATTLPNIIDNQSESNDNETKAENTDLDQSKENDGTTTESNEDDGITEIVDDNTEDKNNTVVKPPKEELESLKTSDEKPKDNEHEENKNETAEERHDNETPPEVLDTNGNTKIAPAGTSNETVKIDETETENVAQNTSELVTENIAEKTDKTVTENVDDKTQSDNGAEGTTTNTSNVNDPYTKVFAENAKPQKNNNTFSAIDDGSGDAENKTSEVTSSAAQSSGTNVVLGIILTVMVIGAVGFGYKYWKNRRSGYRNANTEETHEDGKELQTIVTHHTDPEQN